MQAPALFRSIRFRLALTYTIVVFSIAALVVAGVYLFFARTLDAEVIAEGLEPRRVSSEPGAAIFIEEGAVASFEALVDEQALDRLRTTSIAALIVLFPASLLAGWIISGRALRPVGQITGVAREIQASDLSRRIRLGGPDDELKRLADTFDEMLDRVEQGVEDQRQFIQDTSHELRNPLATMAMNLDVVLDDPDAKNDDLRSTVEVVRGSVDRIASTVNELMRFARQELPESFTGPVDLAGLAEGVAAEFRAPAASRNVVLTVVGQSKVSVRADAEALHAALANLAANAVRFSPAGATVRCGAGVVDGWAWVGVADEGPGIDEEHHRSVFRRNWGRDGTHLSGEPRTGLGLAIVRQVAEAGGGRVTLASEPGKGASFVIWLPRSEGADPSRITDDGIHPINDPLQV